MKTKLVIIISIVACISCKKDSGEAQGNLNNEVKGTVVVDGGAPISLAARGNYTLFKRTVNPGNNVMMVIVGNTGNNSQVQIQLFNILQKGSYPFVTDSATGNGAGCQYMIGTGFNITAMYFSSQSANPGTITIDSISNTYIKGSFTANCSSGSGTAQITNGSFKGNFD